MGAESRCAHPQAQRSTRALERRARHVSFRGTVQTGEMGDTVFGDIGYTSSGSAQVDGGDLAMTIDDLPALRPRGWGEWRRARRPTRG